MSPLERIEQRFPTEGNIPESLSEAEREKFSDIVEAVDELIDLKGKGEHEKRRELQKRILGGDILERALSENDLRGQAMDLLIHLDYKKTGDYLTSWEVPKIVARDLDRLESCIDTSNVVGSRAPLTLLSRLVMSSNSSEAKIGKQALRKHLPFIMDILASSLDSEGYDDIFATYVAFGYAKDFPKLRKWFNEFSEFDSYQVYDAVWLLGDIYSKELRLPDNQKRSVVLMKDLFKSSGIEVASLLPDWRYHQNEDQEPYYVNQNLLTILNLEKSNVGSTKYLHEKLGIIHFARYPQELLQEQFEQREDTSRRYGVIIYPHDDHNGAFHHGYRFWDKLKESRDRLEEKVNIRIAEAKSKTDLVKKLIWLDKKYGSQQKISFALIGGHGTKDSIRFGSSSGEQSYLYVQDLAGKCTEKSRRFFSNNATISLNSCSTGKDEGIGQIISKRLGVEVIAPDKPTAIESLYLNKSYMNDGLYFFGRILDDDGKNVSYRSGEKV